MKNGYVLARNKGATQFFTSSSSYDRPNWVSITEATVYPSAEIAQSAMTKLLKNGSYSTCLRPLSELMDMNPNKPDDLAGQGEGDEAYQDPKDLMKAGTLKDGDEDDINLDDDEIEPIEGGDEPDDYIDDVANDVEGSLGDELDPEHSDRVHPGHPEDEFEDNEQAFLSPLEQAMSKGRRPTQQNIRKAPRLGEAFDDLRNRHGGTPTSKYKSEKIPGIGGGRPIKLSDEEVREMRTMDNKHIPRSTIYNKWPNCAIKTINDILDYRTRLTPACEPIQESDYPKTHKNQTDPTTSKYDSVKSKVDTIKFNQQLTDPADVQFGADLERLDNPNKAPANIIKSLKDGIKDFQKAADFNNGKDDAQASMALTIASAMQDILTDLEQETLEGLKQAQIRITTYWNGITSNFPPEVIDYLYKRGRQPMSLKNIFYDAWNVKRQEDKDY